MVKRLLFIVLVSTAGVQAGFTGNTRVTGFVMNTGQWPANVLFCQQTPNLTTWITAEGLVLDQYTNSDGVRKGHVVEMRWENTQAIPQVEVGKPSTTITYVTPKAGTMVGTTSYESVTLRNVYDGVSVVYYMDNAGRLRYDLDVAVGASVADVAMSFVGDNGMEVATNEVALNTTMGTVLMADLFAYANKQTAQATPAWFRSVANGVQIVVPRHDVTKQLTIDPVVYSTYLGGNGDDVIKSVVYNGDYAYVCGATTGIEFPATVGAYQKSTKGLNDGFVARLSKDLSSVVNYTYFGGTDDDKIVGLALDASGKVCVTGETLSDDLPVTIGSVGQIYKAQIDAFIARFSADLATMEIATFLGGNKDDHPLAIAVEAATGAIYVAGTTSSNAQFPTTLAHQATFGGNEDCFLAKLSPGGGTFVFCTYYGKDGKEAFTSIAVDAAGSPYVTGYTTSSTFETAPTPGKWSSGRVPYDRTYNGGLTDAFVIKFFPDGTLSKKDDGTYSTFFGGSGEDEGRGIYIDAQGRAVIVGVTNSKGLPAAGTLYTEKFGGKDIFMAILTDDGRGLTACTYFGGTGDEDVLGIIAEPSLNGGLMWGTTSSSEFPTTGAGVVSARNGATDGFLTVLNPYTLKFSTLIGGSKADTSISGSFDGSGGFYYALRSTSADLPTGNLSLHKEPIGGADGYVAKWAYGSISLVSPSGGETWCIGVNKSVSWSADGMLDNDVYQIEVSSDGGETWTSVANDVKGLSYNWKPSPNYSTGSNYVIRVFTARGHMLVSSPFTLSAPPKIVSDPVSVSACDGGSIELSVAAEGANLRFQWRRNGTSISGATQPMYSIPSVNAGSAGQYDCVVTGTCNPASTSKPAIVSVAVKTAITEQPSNVTLAEGQSFTVACKATGSDLKYAWFFNGNAIDGANASTYTVASAIPGNSGKYKCTVVGGCGTETSFEATVTVEPLSVQQDIVVGTTSMRVLGPSPAADFVAVRLTIPTDGVVAARLISTNGSVVVTHSFGSVLGGSNTIMLPVGTVASGVYGLELVTDKAVLRTAIQVAR